MDHLLLVLAIASFFHLTLASTAIYGCGIRRRFGVQLISNGQEAELGQWPWHVGLYYGNDYKCGGTLIDQRHVLTSAQCVTDDESAKNSKNQTRKKVTMDASLVRIHLGHVTNEIAKQDQIMNVSKIHVHPEFSSNQDDIALLELSEVVQLSEFVIPICLVGSRVAKLEDLIDKRGSVVGWGMTNNETISNVLKTAQMQVVNPTVCIQSDHATFERANSSKMFCAIDINGPNNVCLKEDGGGMYLLAGDRWELRGISSFAGSKDTGGCGAQNYVTFVNVAHYFEWVMQLTGTKDMLPKLRISERKCLEYRKISQKRNDGTCIDDKYSNTVTITDSNQQHISSGSIISEKFVITKAPNLIEIFELDVNWDKLKIHNRNLPAKEILRGLFHPEYDPEADRHHVLLLELVEPLHFTSELLPACLANEATENLYDILHLNGYTYVNLQLSSRYSRDNSKIISNQQCNSRTQALKFPIKEEEMCTTFHTDELYEWYGIIGGFLQTFNNRSCMYTVVGINKLFVTPASKDKTEYINVYSRVKLYVDWIEEVVWGNETFKDSGEVLTIEEDQISY